MKRVKEVLTKLVKDEKGGPGLEEAVLLIAIGLVVAQSADNMGTVVQTSFTNSVNGIKTALGIS